MSSPYSKKFPAEEGVFHVRLCENKDCKELVLARIIEGKMAVTFAIFRRRGNRREYTQHFIGRWYFIEDLEKDGANIYEWRRVRIR